MLCAECWGGVEPCVGRYGGAVCATCGEWNRERSCRYQGIVGPEGVGEAWSGGGGGGGGGNIWGNLYRCCCLVSDVPVRDLLL